jgi:hypothetical protein
MGWATFWAIWDATYRGVWTILSQKHLVALLLFVSISFFGSQNIHRNFPPPFDFEFILMIFPFM